MYRYTVSNGAMAKQPIVGIWIENIVNPLIGERAENLDAPVDVLKVIDAANKAATPAPSGWYGDIIRSKHRVAWSPNVGTTFSGGGIQQGQTMSGFRFASLDLPGVGEARLEGTGAMFSYPDEGPADDSSVLAELERMRDNDFVARPAAVPTIAVPVPFDAAVLLDRIRAQVTSWPSKQLLDLAFTAQLDRYLAAAANAYRLNQPKAGKENIDAVRKLLAHEHQNLDHDEDDSEDTAEHKAATRLTIDRLAARVLDFDLRYVLKRMEREHEHEGDHRKER